jgi:hypothetical protein
VEEIPKRKIRLVTPGKQYTGFIDVPLESMRTTDVMNSANLFWKNPNKKSFVDAILMYDVKVSIDGIASYKLFDSLQVRLPQVIFFCDEFSRISNEKEKSRADDLKAKAVEKVQGVTIMTRTKMNSFFVVTGKFYGLFKSKTNQKFLPLSDTTVSEIIKREKEWVKRSFELPHSFVGISIDYIESAFFDTGDP